MANLITATNLIVAAVAVVVALLSPRIAWNLTRRSQREDARRRDKLNIFGAIMENRYIFQSREAVRALNLIDVAFHDNQDVRRIWREYHGMISNGAFYQGVGMELTRQKLTELQAAMARDLGYAIDQFDVERVYAPTWAREEEDLQIRERQARLAALAQRRTEDPRPAAAPSAAATATVPSAVYLIRYIGLGGGQGVGTLFIGNGTISGSDVLGGRYAGTYSIQGERIKVAGTLDVAAGAQLVTGVTVEVPTSLPFTADVPLDFGTGQPQTVLLAEQPVLVSFQKIQDT